MDEEEILRGLAEALELERELGVRELEIDRSLLSGPKVSAPKPQPAPRPVPPSPPPKVQPPPKPQTVPPVPPPAAPDNGLLPLVFLHDRALSAGGVEMMAKIVTALHQTPETAPVLFMGPRPAARVTVVLGFKALRHWFPGEAGSPGQWISPGGLSNVLVTYSPEHILRFGAESPAVRKLKLEMWTSLKGALQRIASA